MEFKVLGPLEVSCGGEVIGLGGVKHRALLGYLLLQPNRIVASSRLLAALWPDGMPSSARKMLLNAVSALRGMLSAPGVAIRTHAPGYVLEVDPNRTDLGRFRQLAAEGRIALADEDWDRAAVLLRDALALWRGGVLDDLSQAGLHWPELKAINEVRVAVMEDCFRAELARGRHNEVVGELYTALEESPLRERLSAQLMTALYRGGRQADALGVYQRTRGRLVDELGVEPGRELREVQQQVLDHDPALMSCSVVPSSGGSSGGRKVISVVQVAAPGDDDPETLAGTLDTLAAAVAEEAARFGGICQRGVGSSVMAVFGVHRSSEAADAVRAAVCVRDRLRQAGLSTQVAVATGEALVRPRGMEDVEVTGRVLDECFRLLLRAPAESVLACERTYFATKLTFSYEGRLVGPELGVSALPFADREREIGLVDAVGHQVLRTRRAHLITVLGEPGIGKSRFVAEARGILPQFSFVTEIPPRVTSPTMLVVEDLHGLDEEALDAVAGLAGTEAPLLVLTTARPELLLRRPHWGGGMRGSTTITLDPLPDETMAKLMTSLLDVDPGLLSTLVARVGGNPRFAVDYLGMLTTVGRDQIAERLATVPQPLYHVISGVLGELPAAAKAVLEDAAVLGEHVRTEVIAAVGGRSLAEARDLLDQLVSRDLLRRGGPDEFSFRQVLVRDVTRAQRGVAA